MMEKTPKNKKKFKRETSLMKDLLGLTHRKSLKDNLIQYKDEELPNDDTTLEHSLGFSHLYYSS